MRARHGRERPQRTQVRGDRAHTQSRAITCYARILKRHGTADLLNQGSVHSTSPTPTLLEGYQNKRQDQRATEEEDTRVPTQTCHWNAGSQTERPRASLQRILTISGHFYEGNVAPNQPATYTNTEYALRSNQLWKNLILVHKPFCWKSNVNMALPLFLLT
jgi:hypothetical protein